MSAISNIAFASKEGVSTPKISPLNAPLEFSNMEHKVLTKLLVKHTKKIFLYCFCL